MTKAIAVAPAALGLSAVAARQTPPTGICVVMEEREGAFVLEGVGKRLTEPFEMEAGKYRIEVELTNPSRSDYGISIYFYSRDDGEQTGAFGASDAEKVPLFSSGMVEFPASGEYVAEVGSFRGDWKIVLSPI